MEQLPIIKNITKLFIDYGYTNYSDRNVEIFFNILLNNIEKNIGAKLLSHGCNMKETEQIFDKKYNIFIYNFMNNLDPKSKLNENLSENYKYYLINNLKKYILFILLISRLKSISILKKIYIELFDDFNIKKILHGNIFYLNPYLNTKYIKEIELKSEQKIEHTISRLYTCYKCKKNKTKYTRMQTRSSDEGYTIFINCVECGNKWMEHC